MLLVEKSASTDLQLAFILRHGSHALLSDWTDWQDLKQCDDKCICSDALKRMATHSRYKRPEMATLTTLYHSCWMGNNNLFIPWQQTCPQLQLICMYHKHVSNHVSKPSRQVAFTDCFLSHPVEECQGMQSFEEALFIASNMSFVSKCAQCGVAVTDKFNNVTGHQVQFTNATSTASSWAACGTCNTQKFVNS